MSNFIENCRAYSVRFYESKSGYYYTFVVLAETRPLAVKMAKEYAEGVIGNTCKLKKVKKLPNKPQVLDFYREQVIKMSRFEVGVRVGTAAKRDLEQWNPDEDSSLYGEVIGVKNDKVYIKWDGDWHKPNPEEMNANDSTLFLEADLKDKLSELEKEYSSYADQIFEKVQEAAKLLNEASGIADSHGRDLAKMHDLVSPMLGAMRNAGWRTSALWC